MLAARLVGLLIVSVLLRLYEYFPTCATFAHVGKDAFAFLLSKCSWHRLSCVLAIDLHKDTTCLSKVPNENTKK